MARPPAILFVCLGNICRSPLAEAAFRREAERAGLAVMVDSAGTGDWHVGEPPNPRAIAVARANGVDIAGYRGRQVTPADFERFDVLVATHMDGERLLPSDKGPLWIVYPRDAHTELQDIRYDYRWVWQLVELEVR